MKHDLIQLAKNVFELEAKAVSSLTKKLDDTFIEVLNMIFNSKGRLVICGMGKSGHIGKKIAATLASTGTPSFFMHPGEAYHGDLGMLTDYDIIMLISNSGETEEIIKLIPTLKYRKIPMISITSNPLSTLSKLSDFNLDIGMHDEACLLGLAPTTSTTSTLAMGDALAVCLMQMHDFKPENFAMFHPGGSLGRKLLTKVKDIMVDKNLPIVAPETGFADILHVITQCRLGICIVMEGEKLLGIITDGDLRRALLSSERSRFDFQAKEIMTTTPITIDADENASAIEAIMIKKKNK
ncbi:KpsF/GutQ family protein [Denitrovibrio acetiphilus DSM 12809]|uniref:KpsF/GutQ family protein n=1 Tax=Denitrovibrio acetiphilus (strain DSM 12809 / NBRC 114555 / N2460) TaxID=522772 RepID=D4H3R7_DENA2|nr:KpsF/GutQ family sugar-phosphate isomerase [Denitrovibrio acetiphilus]ADD69169.1 KpsF/GutQ family protein [Denitrovibrio acetiphilus DSM 12809]